MFHPEQSGPASPADPADRSLRRLSAWLEAGSLSLAVVLPLAVAWSWFTADPATLVADAGLPPGALLAPWQVLAGGLLSLLPVLLLAAGLLAARRCFRLFRQGAWFTGGAVAALRDFGSRVVLAGIAGLLLPTLLGLLLSIGNAPGQRALVIAIGSGPVLGILLGGAVWAMALVMLRAVAIAEDHAQIV
ncbi:MAG: hypothetical protein RIB84_21080 [Sneathiellaceae bacterium]